MSEAAMFGPRGKPWLESDLEVVTLWYGEPHNCWRVEINSNDLRGDLENMTLEEARDLGDMLRLLAMDREGRSESDVH